MAHDALYLRLKAVCCHSWGVPPWEFDQMVIEERIAAEDVLETAILAGHLNPLSNLSNYIWREDKAKRDELIKRLNFLVLQVRANKGNPEKQAQLQEEIRRLQHGAQC